MFRVFKSRFFTLFTDLLLMLVAWFILQNRVQSEALEVSQKAAAEVPGLHNAVDDLSGKLHVAKGEITGKQGELDDANEKLTKAREQGDKHRSVVSGKDKQIGRYQTTVKELTGQLSDLKKHFRAGPPVTLLVFIDTSYSMDKQISDFLESLSILFEFMPNTSKDFRVGVIAFRNGVVAEFPITQILPSYSDKKKSQQDLLNFVGSLRTKRSQVNYLPVFQRAAAMLNAAHPAIDPKRKERIILISDTGCGESDNKAGHSGDELKMKDDLLLSVRKWATKGNRGIAALYAESDNSRREPDQHVSKQWFVDLGSVSPKSASYTDANQLLRAVLRASID